MTEYLTPKLPTETVAYSADWAKQLGADIIASYTLVVSSGTVTLSGQEQAAQLIRFLVAGGANGETATLTNTITTVGGQILTRTLSLSIAIGGVTITPSTTTKQTLVNMAFEEIGLAGYEFDAEPEERFSALRRLDGLMAEWKTASLDLGYNFPASFGQGNLSDPTGIADTSVNTVALQLALRIMPAIGKTMSPETRLALSQGMSALRTAYAVIPNRTIPRKTIRGSGSWGSVWRPFINTDDAA